MNYKISTEPGARLRIDKWLWAARFFKTRSLASDAVEKGRVRIGGANVKPSKDVRVGDIVEIDIERIVWQVEVLGICDVRGPATVAQTLYAETAGRPGEAAGGNRSGARRIASRRPACRAGRPSATGALSTNFRVVRIEQLLHGRVHAAVFGVAAVTAPDMQMVVVPATSTSATTAIAKVSFMVLPREVRDETGNRAVKRIEMLS